MRKRQSLYRLGSVIAAGLLAAGWAGLASSGTVDAGNDYVLCHKGHEIQVNEHAVPAHLRHGDTLGLCPQPFPPGAFADFAHAIIGQPFSYNVLANDALAFPTATITAVTGFDANNGCEDFSFDVATGIVSGTPSFGSGSCGVFHYTISNTAGSSTTLVLITVTFN